MEYYPYWDDVAVIMVVGRMLALASLEGDPERVKP
jgi:hypothetical protein